MSYNFLKDVKSIKNADLCMYDSLAGYTSTFDKNGDVAGWTLYDNVYLYGSWEGVLFGTTYHNSCYISRPDPILPIESETFFLLKLMLKVIPKDDNLRPVTAKISWTTVNDDLWNDKKSEEFDLVNNSDWNLYIINLGPNSYWQGDVNNFRLYPIMNGKNGDRFIIQSIRIESTNTYRCTNTDCSYYSNYVHNCPGAGKRGSIESVPTQKYITTTSGVNDTLEVNIDDYGTELLRLGTNNNVHMKNITKQIASQLSRIGVGAYEYSEVDYDDGNRIKITSGNRSALSSVELTGGTALSTLGFTDSFNNDISSYITGQDPASGFDYYGSRRFSYFEINNFIDGHTNTPAYTHDPAGFNVEIGRRDFENSTTSNSMAGVTTTTELTSKLFNNNSTIVDVSHPADNNGRLKTIYVNGSISKDQVAKIFILRPYKNGTLRTLAEYEIPVESNSYIYTSQQITYKIDCNVFINKGDLIGAYNINLSAPFSTYNNKPNATFYQFPGEPTAGSFDPGQLYSHGIMGFNIYGKSSRRTTNLALDIDIGEVANVDTFTIIGRGLTDYFDYNIAACLDVNYQVALYGELHTHKISNYYASEVRYETHNNIPYGIECLSDMITSADNGQQGTGYGGSGSSDGVYTTGNHSYFYVNGDAEWAHNGANYLWQVEDDKFEYSWPDTGARTINYNHDPISFTLVFPENTSADIHRTQIYFKDKRNFKSLSLAYYHGEGSDIGNGPSPHFSLVPEYQTVTVDGIQYNRDNMPDTLLEDVSPLLFKNPTIRVRPKFIGLGTFESVNTNQSEVLTDYRLNWNIISHSFTPINCKGFMIHTDYHESTKITEMEIYSRFYVSPSLADKVYTRFSRYGNDWTTLGFTSPANREEEVASEMASAIRYIHLDIDAYSPLEINEIGLYISNDVKLEGCDTSVLLNNTKKGTLSDVTKLDIENVYDKTYDLTVDLPRDITDDLGWLSWITLEDQAGIDLPNVGAGAILNKKYDYPIQCVNQQLANNCDTYVLDNIAKGKPIYINLDGDEWTHLTDYDTSTSLDIHNNTNIKETTINIAGPSSKSVVDSSSYNHTVTTHNDIKATEVDSILGLATSIEFSSYRNLHFPSGEVYDTRSIYSNVVGGPQPDQPYLSIEPSNDWDMGAEPCTIEFFFKLYTIDYAYIAKCWDDTDQTSFGNWYFYMSTSGKLSFKANGSTDTSQELAETFITNKWYHLSAVSDGTSLNVYIDGALSATKPLLGPFGNSDAPIILGTSPAIEYGSWYSPGEMRLSSAFHGAMAEIRVLKGITSHTRPELPYTSNAHTKLLIHSTFTGAINAKYWKIQNDLIEDFDIDHVRAYYRDELVPIKTLFINSARYEAKQLNGYSYEDSGYNKGVVCLPSLLVDEDDNAQDINWVQSSKNTSNSYMLNTEHTLSVGSYGASNISGAPSSDYHGPVVSTILNSLVDFTFNPKIYIDSSASSNSQNSYIDIVFKSNTVPLFSLRLRYNNETNKYNLIIFKGAYILATIPFTYTNAITELRIDKNGTALNITGSVLYSHPSFFNTSTEETDSLEVRFMATSNAQSEVKYYLLFAEKVKTIKTGTPFPGDYTDTFGLGFESNTNIDKIVLRHTGNITSDKFDIYASQFNVNDYTYVTKSDNLIANRSYDLDVVIDLTVVRHIDIVRSHGSNTNNIFFNKKNQVAYSSSNTSNPSNTSWAGIKPTLLLQVESGALVDNSQEPYDDMTAYIYSGYTNKAPIVEKNFSPFDTGASLYFDGTAAGAINYKSMDKDTELLLLTNKDFTISWWEYRLNSGPICSASKRTMDTIIQPGWAIMSTYEKYEDGLNALQFSDGTSYYYIAPWSYKEWCHYTVTRKNGKLFMFKNGKLTAIHNCTTNIGTTGNPIDLSVNNEFILGSYTVTGWNSGDKWPIVYKGWLSDFTVINGTALWTDDFTRPSIPYTYGGANYTNARWLKFQLSNGAAYKQSIDKLGIYPDISTPFAEGGGYNCSWVNYGSMLTNYNLFTENLCLGSSISGSSSTSISGALYAVTQFVPTKAINGEIFPYTFDKCWGWSSEDVLPTLDIDFDNVNPINKIKMYHGPGQNSDYIIEDYNISVYDPSIFTSAQTNYSAIYLHYDSIDVSALEAIGITVISGAPDDYTILYGQKQDLAQLFNYPSNDIINSLTDALSATGYIINPNNIKVPYYTKIETLVATPVFWYNMISYTTYTFNSLQTVHTSVRLNDWYKDSDGKTGYYTNYINDLTSGYRIITGDQAGSNPGPSQNELPSDWMDSVSYTANSSVLRAYINWSISNICVWFSNNSDSVSVANYNTISSTYEEELPIASSELVSYLATYLIDNSLEPLANYSSEKHFENIISVTGNTLEETTHTFGPVNAESIRLEITKYKSAGKSVTSANAAISTNLDGGFLREIEVYKSIETDQLNSEDHPIIATNLKDNFNITSIDTINNHIEYENGKRFYNHLWETDFSYLHYSSDILEDPQKIAFRPNVSGKVTYYDSGSTGYSTETSSSVGNTLTFNFSSHVNLSTGTYTLQWQAYNNIQPKLISIDIEGAQQSHRLYAERILSEWSTQETTFTINESASYSISASVNTDETDLADWGAKNVIISKTVEESRWLVIKNDFAQNYDIHDVDANKGTNYISKLLVYGDEKYNPVEHHWWWTSAISTLENDGFLTKEAKRSLKVNYPISSGDDYVEFLQGDNFGNDIYWSEMDLLEFWWYIEDVDKLDTEFGGFAFGSFNPVGTIGFYMWDLIDLNLSTGWNKMALSFNTPSDVYPQPLGSRIDREEQSDLQLHTLRSFGLVYKGVGEAFTMNIDSIKIRRNRFDTEVVNGRKGLCLTGNESLQVPVAGLDLSKGSIEFWLKPYYSHEGYDVFNHLESRNLFTLVGNNNDLVSLGVRSTSWFEIGVGNAHDNYKSIHLEDPSVVSDNVLFGYMEPIHIAMLWSNDGAATDNGATIKLYINGELTISSHDTWEVAAGDQGAVLKLGGGNTTLAMNNDIDGCGIFHNLKLYNYCKADFDINVYEDDITTYNPADFVELSTDGTQFYNNTDGVLPFVFPNVPVGEKRNIYIRANKNEKFDNSRAKTTELMIQWITTV